MSCLPEVIVSGGAKTWTLSWLWKAMCRELPTGWGLRPTPSSPPQASKAVNGWQRALGTDDPGEKGQQDPHSATICPTFQISCPSPPQTFSEEVAYPVAHPTLAMWLWGATSFPKPHFPHFKAWEVTILPHGTACDKDYVQCMAHSELAGQRVSGQEPPGGRGASGPALLFPVYHTLHWRPSPGQDNTCQYSTPGEGVHPGLGPRVLL